VGQVVTGAGRSTIQDDFWNAIFAYKNDTFITNGIFPENIILDARRFSRPTDLIPSRSNRDPGVAFLYHLREDDLDSAARFENQRP
jgi:hypothetical protein